MNQNGFTLVEVLMVIVLLAIIFALLAPNLGIFEQRIGRQELEKQREMVISAANMYVNDNNAKTTNDGQPFFHNGVARRVERSALGVGNVDNSIRFVCIPATIRGSICVNIDEGCSC